MKKLIFTTIFIFAVLLLTPTQSEAYWNYYGNSYSQNYTGWEQPLQYQYIGNNYNQPFFDTSAGGWSFYQPQTYNYYQNNTNPMYRYNNASYGAYNCGWSCNTTTWNNAYYRNGYSNSYYLNSNYGSYYNQGYRTGSVGINLGFFRFW